MKLDSASFGDFGATRWEKVFIYVTPEPVFFSFKKNDFLER